MTLTFLETLTGAFSLTIVVISTIVGARIALKYFEAKRIEFILVGLTWILLCEIWWSSAFSFMSALATGHGLTPEIYFLIGNIFVPVALFIWLTAFTKFIYHEKQKILQLLALITGAIYYIIFFVFLVIDVSMIGVMFNPVDAEYRGFALMYLICVLSVFLITGILFAKESLRSSSPETKLRGKLILLAVLSFTIGAALDGLKPVLFSQGMEYVLVIDRVILISSALEFYLAFSPPTWFTKMFVQTNTKSA